MDEKIIKVSTLALLAVLGYLLFFGKTIENQVSNVVFDTTQSITNFAGYALGMNEKQKQVSFFAILQQFTKGAIL